MVLRPWKTIFSCLFLFIIKNYSKFIIFAPHFELKE